MKRLYQQLITNHFRDYRQMIFLAGPRQVGKTTTSFLIGEKTKTFYYFNWDDLKTRQQIISNPSSIAEDTGLLKISKYPPLLVFDEIHKYGAWKQFLKGFFDMYGDLCHIMVTGSAKLNIYKRIGDSLMGRYFLYRIHPLSVGEILHPNVEKKELRPPQKIPQKTFEKLLIFGGFPEPYLKANRRFSTNWKRMRQEQLIQEDIRSLSQIQELHQLETLAILLADNVSCQISKTSLAKQINVSIPTIQRWLQTLESFYYSFQVKPWTTNIRRSLRKEPKYYLWDWAQVNDPGARLENFVASHLLKAVHFWTDYGLGEYQLHYLRDKEKREVDFLVTKNNIPWFLVEVKASNNSGLSKSLFHFQEQTEAPHAFQVSFGLDFVDKDCFSYNKPIIVPATTFLSQLI